MGNKQDHTRNRLNLGVFNYPMSRFKKQKLPSIENLFFNNSLRNFVESGLSQSSVWFRCKFFIFFSFRHNSHIKKCVLYTTSERGEKLTFFSLISFCIDDTKKTTREGSIYFKADMGENFGLALQKGFLFCCCICWGKGRAYILAKKSRLRHVWFCKMASLSSTIGIIQ